MKALTVYECEYCKKLFRTPDRHHCKFNPELKNCFTCKYHKGWVSESYYNEPSPPAYPDCDVDNDSLDIEDIKFCNYNMQCESYEQGEYEMEAVVVPF